MTSAFVLSATPLPKRTTTFGTSVSNHASRPPTVISPPPSARLPTRMVGELPTVNESIDETSSSDQVTTPRDPDTIASATSVIDTMDPETTSTSSFTLGVEEEEEEKDYEPCSPPQFVLNQMAITESREKFKVHETDTGSPEYQIATLTTRINYLTTHLKQHPKDHSSTRGLLRMVSNRRRLLKYVKKQDPARFSKIIEGLGIRVSQELRRI